MKVDYDTMATWCNFMLKCDCNTAVKAEWNLCPNCGKPIEKPKFGKCHGDVVSVRPSEVARIIEKAMFASAQKKRGEE